MTKKLAVFCDGTWGHLATENITNVARLAKCVGEASTRQEPQIVFYDEGVGVPRGVGGVAGALERLVGGATGEGLDFKIERAYRFLVLNYEPGDDVYVFGFSRGAYTARSLCGLIRKCGILRREWFDWTSEAMRYYRDGSHPNSEDMRAFRRKYAHDRATGEHDFVPLRPGERRAAQSCEELFQYRPESAYRIMYLGVWDTVGSLGVPDKLWFSDYFNKKYRFHDLAASSLIASIRHAVAIDERRRVFDASLIDNIDALNQEWAERTGWYVGDDAGREDYVPFAYRPYQQQWFPGDHGSVGGGNEELGLSSAALSWIADGARVAGLKLCETEDSELERALKSARPDAPLKSKLFDFLRLGGTRRRMGPARLDELSIPARERHRRLGRKYRPRNLRPVLKTIPDGEPALPPRPRGFPLG